MQHQDATAYLETRMKVIERKSDKKKLCKWEQKYKARDMKAALCLLSIFPGTRTLVFKKNPTKPDVNLNEMVFIKGDKSTKETRGYSGNSNSLYK